MREPEPLHGLRVVATPAAVDAIATGTVVVRIAPDEAFVIGASDLRLDDPHAIVEPESAFVGWWLEPDEVADLLGNRVEWVLPTPLAGSSQLAQGLVAGVPMKLWVGDATDDARSLLIVSRSLAHEAHDRLFGAHA
ncbi:MAG: hypothetical protein HZB15_02845 [Actinobacteria bacterium]|nr:hypothetical protein [Actinomycetota bacterium]